MIMEKGNRPIPNRLNMHRRLMRYSRIQVVQLLDLQNTSILCQWEKGRKLPSAINLIKLSIIYRTYPNELYPQHFNEQMLVLRQKERDLFKV